MAANVEREARRVRVAALLLIVALLAGPVGTHVYWLFGGTWGLYGPNGNSDGVSSTGVRVLAAIVIVLLAAAILVVLSRAGVWRQTLVPDRAIQSFAWALVVVFSLETVASFTWSREHEWWMYGPVSLVIALLALLVASAGGAQPQLHRTLPSH